MADEHDREDEGQEDEQPTSKPTLYDGSGDPINGAPEKGDEKPEPGEGEVVVTKFETTVPDGAYGLFIAYDPKTQGISAQPIGFNLTDRQVLYVMLEVTRDLAVQNMIQSKYGLVDQAATNELMRAKREAARLGLDPSKIGPRT